MKSPVGRLVARSIVAAAAFASAAGLGALAASPGATATAAAPVAAAPSPSASPSPGKDSCPKNQRLSLRYAKDATTDFCMDNPKEVKALGEHLQRGGRYYIVMGSRPILEPIGVPRWKCRSGGGEPIPGRSPHPMPTCKGGKYDGELIDTFAGS
ncbi:hypothetical protein [Streptomyces sp. KL118A]|uniref:hypothetical protein n=1 Tax=Streptomyces sp. KL118A TaxID=3045153 RepID=UPI00278C09B8|nr:hypothetical protein [Streptomyces sp. KL118A]